MFRSTETPCFAFGKGKIVPVGHNFKESQMENTTSKTGGRPPKSRIEKHHRVVSTRLTELQFYAMRKRATQAGVPLSNYIRQAVIRGEIIRRMNRHDAEIIRQLAGEANNLNQLARRANTAGFVLIVQELLKLKAKIVEIINQLSDDWKNNQGKRV